MFQNISRLIHETSPNLLFIFEARVFQSMANVIRAKLKFKNWFCVDVVGQKGGPLLLWNENISITILSYSKGHIDCCVSTSPTLFYFTGFYSNPNRSDYFCFGVFVIRFSRLILT